MANRSPSPVAGSGSCPVFKLDWVRPAVVADGLAELQIRWPSVPIIFSEARQLADEWTYRYLAAAHAWTSTEIVLTWRAMLRSAAQPFSTSAEAAYPPVNRTAVMSRCSRDRSTRHRAVAA